MPDIPRRLNATPQLSEINRAGRVAIVRDQCTLQGDSRGQNGPAVLRDLLAEQVRDPDTEDLRELLKQSDRRRLEPALDLGEVILGDAS